MVKAKSSRRAAEEDCEQEIELTAEEATLLLEGLEDRKHGRVTPLDEIQRELQK